LNEVYFENAEVYFKNAGGVPEERNWCTSGTLLGYFGNGTGVL
jgi:hypothetical protein